MHRSELNSSQPNNKPINPVKQDNRINDKPLQFEAIVSNRPERLDLESILPFLEERVAFKMPSDLQYLDGVLDYLNERMLKLGIVGPDDSEVVIALDEAIVNAVKHGNKGNPRKAVHIVAEFNSQGARFTIKDEGTGFCKDSVPDPTDPSRILETSGRGLLLINHIMDEVCHNHCGNEIQMFKRITQSAREDSPESKNTGQEE